MSKAAETDESQPPVPAIRDASYTESKHTHKGKDVQRDLRRGREVHVFNDDVDLGVMEERVWRDGVAQGRVGSADPARAGFDRFVWYSEAPVGTRIETGKRDVPLHYVEIKGKMVNGCWVYHLAPRVRPAT